MILFTIRAIQMEDEQANSAILQLRDITAEVESKITLEEQIRFLSDELSTSQAELQDLHSEIANMEQTSAQSLTQMRRQISQSLNAILNLSRSIRAEVYGQTTARQNQVLDELIQKAGQLQEKIRQDFEG